MPDGVRRLAQASCIAAGLFIVCASSFAAADPGPGDCLGVDFDVQHPVTIAKVIADKPQVHFVKNASDEPACPAEADDCQDTRYLVPGDLMLVGKTHGAYSCVSYQSAADRRQNWTVGWVRSTSLTPVAPTASPSRADWIGTWIRAGGRIAIRRGPRGKLRINGEAVYPAAESVHNGVIRATAMPANGMLQFANNGTAFDQASADAGDCLVRMQRIADLMVVQDNAQCGGVMVTFTGFYRRK